MKFNISIFLFLLLITILQKPSSIQGQDDCEPGCANRFNKHCNRFEIQLRATMIRCNQVVSPFTTTVKSSSIKDPGICKCSLTCGKKLHATLKLINQGETATNNQYVIIDHVIDATTGQRVSLLNPYVVILRQKPLMQLYGLKRRNVVNAEAREHVINKKSPNFSGCDDISENPTCGNMRYNGDSIPYSQGFCCSCDEKKNVRRQPRSTDKMKYMGNFTPNVQEFIYNNMKWNENTFNLENLRSKKSIEPRDFNDYRSSIRLQGKNPIIYVTPKIINKEKFSRNAGMFLKPSDKIRDTDYEIFDDGYLRPNFKMSREQHNIQIRGGQNCDDLWTPRLKVNPATYHDSAHCLRFSKLWYAMYQMSDPVLDHSVYIRIFEKRETDDGSTVWADLTGGKTISVGSLNPKYEDCSMQVSYDCYQQGGDPLPYALDPKQKKLLIPENNPKMDNIRHPECEGGASEYLVVDTRSVQTSGDQCDTVGVGYSAFYNQPQRCSVPKGSCLRNQPSELWRRDRRACKQGQRGQYFLKNFAVVPDDAVRRTKKEGGDSKYLALHYGPKYKSTIDIEIKADDNIVFRNAPMAKITEVYVDSTSATATILTIKIHNNGLTSNLFHPRLTDCPLELPVDWGNLEGDPELIPPQHHSTFTLRLLGILPVDNFFCSVEALTTRNEIVAVRRIRVVKTDRCICSWHCLCACYIKTGLGCVLMSMDHYRAAGFIGSMPLSTNMVQVSYLESVVFGFFFFALLLIIILLLMGLTKALIGYCFFVPVGIWGLDMLIGLRPMERYYEEQLDGRNVIYDEEGWPVHPDSKYRNVRIVEEKIEFCLNVIFFFTYPVMLMILLCSKMCCPYYAYSGDEDKGVVFKGVNTVSYTKCPVSKQSSDSDFCNEEMFEFEDYEICTND